MKKVFPPTSAAAAVTLLFALSACTTQEPPQPNRPPRPLRGESSRPRAHGKSRRAGEGENDEGRWRHRASRHRKKLSDSCY